MNDISNYKVDIRSDLIDMGMDECGTPYTAESYYVVIVREDGRTFAHNHLFSGCIRHTTEDGFPFFEDTREHAKKECMTLAGRVLSRGSIDPTLWTEIAPSYGSDYYCKKYGF